jgi:hypothetical protein
MSDILVTGAAGSVGGALIVAPAHPQMVAMTASAVAAAKAGGVAHLVRIPGAGADPASPVGALHRMGMPEAVVEMMSSLTRIIAAGQVAEVTDAVRAVTGNVPRTLATFAHEHAAAWR